MARLIDGDALIAWIKGSQQMTSKMKSIICYIKTMPTIEARPKGKWTARTPSDSGLGAVYECPYCKYEVDCVPTNFCPNCGADMREREGE